MMNNQSKITNSHLLRKAIVYVRQSTNAQVEHNRESTQRQYKLVDHAMELGWQKDQIQVIDDDLGVSGTGLTKREGFAKMTTQIALSQAGIVLSLEASRLARNNADWYKLLDLCGVTDTLISDADGIYHPANHNDRLMLGMKGTWSEAESYGLRVRLVGGMRNKAERGELRISLPVGLIWGEAEGEILFHPDEAVTGAVHAVFKCFGEMGSVRRVWMWFCAKKLLFPFQSGSYKEIQWVKPSYLKIHKVLTNPVYAGAYVYGKSRQESYVDKSGELRKRTRHLPQSEWSIVIRDHHPGFIDWETYEANQARISQNARPRQNESGGAVREGSALLQGIATCACCGRKLVVHYNGRNSTGGYHCPGSTLVEGKSCLRVRGCRIDSAVASAFLASLAPAGLEAALQAAEQLETEHDAALAQWQRQVERAKYEAQRAERRYLAVDPDNRLVARGLEREWERCLRALQEAESELKIQEQRRPRELSVEERTGILALGEDIERVWSADTTTDRDRKELLRTLLEEVIIAVDKEKQQVHLTQRWRGGLITDLDVELSIPRRIHNRTDEDTVDLIRRLAQHYPDNVISGILNRQGRTTATGLPFTTSRLGNLRNHWGIPLFKPSAEPSDGDLVNVREAAEILGVSPSTLHRHLNDGIIPGEQLTPGSPWRVRITDELRTRYVEEASKEYLPIVDAMRRLGVSRQTVLQRVKRGELEALHVSRGQRKGLRIKVKPAQPGLFDDLPSERG